VTRKRLSLLLGKVDRLNLKGAVLRRSSDLVVGALGSSPSWYLRRHPEGGNPRRLIYQRVSSCDAE
jgi:hypothetical protein